MAAMIVNRSNEVWNLHRLSSICDITKFQFIWPSGFRGDYCFEIEQPETKLPMAVIFLADRNKMSNLNSWPSIDASCKVSVHLT